jgi:hypothetical protein
MTLVVKVSEAFTDPTLPLLVADDALASANGGGRFLLDFKNRGSWSSQGTAITKSDPLYSLTGAGATGVAPGTFETYAATFTQAGKDAGGVDGTVQNAAVFTPGMTYDPATGVAGFSDVTGVAPFDSSTLSYRDVIAGRFIEQENGPYIFDDLSANYAISLWVKWDSLSTTSGHFFCNKIDGSNSRAGVILLKSGLNVGIQHRSCTGFPINATTTQSANQINSTLITPNATELQSRNGILRIGYAWRKQGAGWLRQTALNQVVNSEQALVGFDTTGIDCGQSTHDGPRNSRWLYALGLGTNNDNNLFGFAHTNGICRLYVENTTISGRSAQEVWEADWAVANDRFG